MAALQARARPIAPTYEEQLDVASLSSLNSADGTTSEPDWRIIDETASPTAQAVSLPVHDGQGIFPMSDESIMVDSVAYASARGDASWIHHPSATTTDSSSARLSFSTSSSSAVSRRRPRTTSAVRPLAGPSHPLTEHALASVNSHANREHEDEEAVLTSSSASEASDVEDLLSRTPQAASAGLTPRRLRIDRAGVKRRHRMSGVSSHGSKRSNTDSSRSVPLPLQLQPEVVARGQRMVETPPKVFLGKVVRNVLAVDEETIDMVAHERPAPLPRAPLPRYRHGAMRRASAGLHGLPALREHVRRELGDLSGPAALVSTDAGGETETEHGDHRRQVLTLVKRVEPVRSMSMSDLPNMVDSIYASLPSEYLISPADSTFGRRSLEAETPRLQPPMSYWRSILQRIKAGLESAL